MATNPHPLRVAINAQLPASRFHGGVQTLLVSIVKCLGELTDGPEEYVVIGPPTETEWLRPYLGPNQTLVAGPGGPETEYDRRVRSEPLKKLLGPLRPAVRSVWRRLWPQHVHVWPEVPVSNGFYESLGCDVIHFPWQQFTVCAMPTVYQPADIQHLHYPQFFRPEELAWREVVYRVGCNLSHAIVVTSQWVKDDLARHYGVRTEKVQVIAGVPPAKAFAASTPEREREVLAKYRLRQPFAFYPAMPWPHKNHQRLFEAVAMLRDRRGLKVNLVCTCSSQDPKNWARVQNAIRELKLEEQVVLLDLAPSDDLRPLYRLAQFVVVPTLFEAASAPMGEAWMEGTPVASSNVTSLPEQAGDAALLFDPMSVDAIADAMARLATDEALRQDLSRRGTLRLQDFSWENTARAYRALYRKCAKLPLSDEDRFVLSWDWMREPRRRKGDA